MLYISLQKILTITLNLFRKYFFNINHHLFIYQFKNVTFLPKRRVENRNSSWVGVIMSQVAKISAFQPQVKNQKNLEWAKRTSDFWFFTSGWKALILATSDIMTPTNDEFLILHESFWQEWHYYIIVDASWPLYNNCGKNYIIIKRQVEK